MSNRQHEPTADQAQALRAQLTQIAPDALTALAEDAKFVRALEKHDAELAGLLAAVNKANTDMFRALSRS